MRLLFESGDYLRAAFIYLSEKSFVNTCTKGLEFCNINSELTCGDLISERNVQLLDQLSLFNKAVPTRHLQFVSSFSSAKEDKGELEEDKRELEENEVALEDC